MTLPEVDDVKMPEIKKKEKQIAKTLMKVLERARDAGRVTSGVFECATHLEEDPYRIMVCLLPVTAPTEVAMSIQHKLIEAYCLENDIQVVKFNHCEKVGEILSGNQPDLKTDKQNPVTMATPDCSCVLIDWPPKTHANKLENRLMEDVWPNQIIDLPI